MLYRLRRRWNYWRFNRIIGSIFETRPLDIVESPLRIVSMVSVARDIPMYLLAAKTLYSRLGHGRFVMMPDAPLPEAWRAQVHHHLGGGVEFLPIADVETGRCQRGGCWERLLACVDLSARHYVVQMDADTLALREVPEVSAAIQANHAFTLGEGLPIQTFEEAARAAQPAGEHVIDAAQRAFGRHPRRHLLRYVRASAGFAGFAQGTTTRAAVEEFHEEMSLLLGRDTWLRWGSEQIASNVLIANAPSPVILSHPEHASVTATTDFTRLRFGHFIGSHRFVGQRYARAGAKLIQELLAESQPSAAEAARAQA